ncbi:MAG: hypothetical protein IPQ02_15225 [Saprospiraceae bacterium]|nr:hypothetical protein [Candidatus Defluviibacterium haderslevense]
MGNKICLSEGFAQNSSQKALIQSKFQCSKSSLGSLRNSAISRFGDGFVLGFFVLAAGIGDDPLSIAEASAGEFRKVLGVNCDP